ncbi:GntR family transcriptional regulator [Pseudalkalibacillus hwajinpoensis]|uniref:GntR family transcriptional regulator n=1 Tax=Guptibacillus hwajinpoensis TaxID=208199 RepID=UPI001CD2AAE3|nr:GntR family transcriptional regulator [Pseudalkalibacillus hwajinpoensis]MCA0991329.1 GntR family transcriptional regulator [Pseudalkalibacillus hwajinpoensis]
MERASTSPKYTIIEKHFKELISNGEIQPGDQLPTENELVEQFGVSRHTIRRAFTNLEHEGYIDRGRGKGTFCSFNFGTKKTKSKTIAIITTYISDYIFPRITSGIEEVLSSKGYHFLLLNTNNNKEKEQECLRKALELNVAGVIIEPTLSAKENTNKSYFRELEKKNIPYIMINSKYEEVHPSYIVLDDLDGGYKLTNHLVELGHHKIAGIFKSDDAQGVNRYLGYAKSLISADLTMNNSFVGKYKTEEKEVFGYNFAKELLLQEDHPTAFVCYNDQIALQVIQAIKEAQLIIPNDIAVVGFDDSYIATATDVKLTSAIHPKEVMGEKVAKGIVDLIEGRINEFRYTLSPEIVVRNSTLKN